MGRSKNSKCPLFNKFIEPTFTALIELGGSATIDEIKEKVISIMNLKDDVIDEPHGDKEEGSQRTELEYQLTWARTYLKNYGAIINSKRGVWTITSEFSKINCINENEVVDYCRKKNNKNVSMKEENDKNSITNSNIEIPEELEPWKDELAEALHKMNPFGFERLSKRLLRECGFTQVEVTKQTGDGGIDGRGILKINGIISFNVAFQCKRYVGSVPAAAIRDFRGSLTADIEKGIFITTGIYTKAALEEAVNPGKKQIDLIDGEEFINKLIEYRIGVSEKTIYEVDKEFFETI